MAHVPVGLTNSACDWRDLWERAAQGLSKAFGLALALHLIGGVRLLLIEFGSSFDTKTENRGSAVQLRVKQSAA